MELSNKFNLLDCKSTITTIKRAVELKKKLENTKQSEGLPYQNLIGLLMYL